MTMHSDNPPLGTDIRAVLARLRRRIKAYVWLEGLALALLWLGATFWIGLAIDYLPVLVGASEMPRGARAILLALIAAMLVYVMYRWIFRRAFARMPDHSMAVLLERRFGRFHDALVTAVEMDDRPDHAEQFNPEMLARTRQEAEARTVDVRVRQVFRLAPLIAKIALAAAVIAPIGLLYAVNARAVETWVNRLYWLGNEPWPRNTQIAVAGIQIQRTTSTDGSVSVSDLLPFDDSREIKIAKGTSVLLKVRADATKVIPEYCTIYYQTEEGDHATVTMQKLGRIRDNFQTYVCDSKPFRGILSTIRFDVRGLDHRVRDYRLTVVPSPIIVKTELSCTFPRYMVDERLSLWLPRTVELANGTQLPNGTHIEIRVETNKDLSRVEIRDSQTDETTVLDIRQTSAGLRHFEYQVERLNGNLSLDVSLHDTDGVVSDPPIRLFIAGVEDTAPVVKTTLRGIGTAVTPDVVIPATGEISDDYDVDKSWFEVTVNDGAPREYPFPLGELGRVTAQLDFRAERASEGAMELKPKDKIAVTLIASDKCDLRPTPNIGSGDRYQLDVVTPEELLAMLERKELGLRRRLEQIIDELSETRDSLSRIKRPTTDSQGTAPEDARQATEKGAEEAADPSLGETAEERTRSLRLLRTQRSLVQSDKSAQEVLGVAASIDDIRDELINNRVDTKDRESRLKAQIADPLRRIGETMFPELNHQLKTVQQQLDDPAASDQAVDLAVEQADAILLELDKVLQKMLELESFNELMNIVRSLIEDQQEIIEKTQEEQKKGALELLK